ncbi:hypothetical protein TWF730_009414 [Orbilia blumenaviensis]|uniref:Uncharacterized protein n=1 Tax=Orbilia blumenaviensis TaxID=1796055 RepID=A0AAV9V4S3_9PEZI
METVLRASQQSAFILVPSSFDTPIQLGHVTTSLSNPINILEGKPLPDDIKIERLHKTLALKKSGERSPSTKNLVGDLRLHLASRSDKIHPLPVETKRLDLGKVAEHIPYLEDRMKKIQHDLESETPIYLITGLMAIQGSVHQHMRGDETTSGTPIPRKYMMMDGKTYELGESGELPIDLLLAFQAIRISNETTNSIGGEMNLVGTAIGSGGDEDEYCTPVDLIHSCGQLLLGPRLDLIHNYGQQRPKPRLDLVHNYGQQRPKPRLDLVHNYGQQRPVPRLNLIQEMTSNIFFAVPK